MVDGVVVSDVVSSEVRAKFTVGGFERRMLSVGINDEMGHQLCDVLEGILAGGGVLPSAVYALAERIAHRIDPGCFFGVQSDRSRPAA